MTGEIIGGHKNKVQAEHLKSQKKHSLAKHAKSHHQQQSSKTLMRHSVKKPSASSSDSVVKSQGVLHAHLNQAKVEVKHSAHKVNRSKLNSALRVKKSQHVHHFSNKTEVTVSPLVSHPSQHHIHHKKHPKRITPKPRTTAELLEHAVAQATSHEEKFVPETKKYFKKLSRNSALALSVGVLIISVVAIKAFPFIKTKSASANAGFSVVIPKHQPSGFSITKLDAKPGTININYKSNSDSRSFVVTEQVSNWSDEALRAKQSNSSVLGIQAINTGNKTIYIDSNYNAKWIDSGIYYSVDGSGVLSTKQIVEIANSL